MTSENGNATANRMTVEASEHVAGTVQEIVEEVAETHAGAAPEQVAEAVQEKWTDKVGEAAPPLGDDKAAEYAEHIVEGKDVTVVPVVAPATPAPTPETGP